MNTGTRVGRLAALLVAAFVVHAALAGSLAVWGARPALALAALLVACLFVHAPTGALLGLLVGVLEGAYSGAYVGSIIVTRVIAGWTVGALEDRVFRDNVVVALAVVAAGTALVELCFFLFAPQPDVGGWIRRTLATAAYNGLLAIPLFVVARRLARPPR